MSNRLSLWLFVAVVLLLPAWAPPAVAAERLSGHTVTVAPGRILGPLFVAGQDVVINADVDGDVFAAGTTIVVNGRVGGDLLAAGQTILVNGAVTGSVRGLADHVLVRAGIGRNLTAVARSLQQLPGSTVSGDVVALTQNTTLSGAVGRQVLGAGTSFTLNGPVGGGGQLWSVGRLHVEPNAVIRGTLDYASAHQAQVDPGAKITGKVNWQPVAVNHPLPHRRFNWWWLLVSFAAGALAWGLLALLFPGFWGGLGQMLQRSPWPALGLGFIALVAVPAMVLVLLVSLVGIPLSLMLLAAYVAVIYAAKLIVADLAGRLLAARLGWETPFLRLTSFLAGFAALILLGKIPLAGLLISLAVACLGLGTVILAVYRRRPGPALPVSPD